MATIFLTAVPDELGSFRQSLHDELEAKGHVVRGREDFSPERRPVLYQLEDFLARCDAVILLVGDRFGPEPAEWDRERYGEQRHSDLQWAFLLARKYEIDVHLFCPFRRVPRDRENEESEELRRLQERFVRECTEEAGLKPEVFQGVDELLEQVARLEASWPREASRTVDETTPYAGLRALEEDDREAFCGRMELVDELNRRVEEEKLTVVLGPSGVGKTSLVRAGWLPAWRKAHPDGEVIMLGAGKDPVANLRKAMIGLGLPPSDRGGRVEASADQIREWLKPEPGQPDEETERGNGSTWPKDLLLVIDPAEELLLERGGRAASERRAAFLDALVEEVSRDDAGLRIVLVLRDEEFACLHGHEGLARLADGRLFRVPKPGEQELRKLIVEPARRHGVRFEDGLVVEMLVEAEGLDEALPLLHDALRQWWKLTIEGKDHDGVLRGSKGHGPGGIRESLRARCSDFYRTRSEAERQALRNIWSSMVDLRERDGEIKATARAAPRLALVESGGSRGPDLLDDLVREGLLLMREESGDPTLELAHEVLLREWPELRDCVELRREAIRLRSAMRRDAETWKSWRKQWRWGKARAVRWSGGRLERALELNRTSPGAVRSIFAQVGGLGRWEEEFLDVSRRRWYAKKRRPWLLAGALGALLLVAAGFGWQVWKRAESIHLEKRLAEVEAGRGWLLRARLAREEGRDVEAGFFAAVATGFEEAGKAESPAGPTDAAWPGWVPDQVRFGRVKWPDAGSVFPWNAGQAESYPRLLTRVDSPSSYEEARRILGEAPRPFLWSSPPRDGEGVVRCLAVQPDGRALATGSASGNVTLWDVATGRGSVLPSAEEAGKEPLHAVAFSRDGSILAAGGGAGGVRLWDVAAGRETSPLETGGEEEIRTLAFHPDGGWVATGGARGGVAVRNLDSLGETVILAGHESEVEGLAFSPDGVHLASGSRDGEVTLWDWRNGFEVASFEGAEGGVTSLVFSPDGSSLAGSGSDGLVRRWKVPGGEVGVSFEGHADAVTGVAFRPDGGLLASASRDGTLRLWDPATGDRVATLSGHFGPVGSVVFSPGGKVFFSFGDDGTVKLWDVPQPAAERSPFDWFRYVEEGWVRLGGEGDPFTWILQEEGLAMADRNLPEASWPAILRRQEEEERDRQLLASALAAKNWDTAVLLRIRGSSLPSPSHGETERQAVAALVNAVGEALGAGRIALAERRMAQGDVLFPDDADWAILRADHLAESGYRGEALSFYRRVDDVRGWRGVARLTGGEEALELWRRILEREGVRAEDYRLAGRQAAALGREEESRDIFSRGLERFGDDAALQVAYGSALHECGDLALGLMLLESGVAGLREDGLTAEDETLAAALRQWASALLAAGKTQEAWAAYETVLRGGAGKEEPFTASLAEQGSVDLLTGAMYVGMLLGRDEAEDLFAEAKDRAEGPVERALVLRRRGWGLLSQDRAAEAYSQFGQALAECAFDPTDAAEPGSDLRAGLAAAGWLTGSRGAALDEFELLWQQRAEGERWDEPEYVEALTHLPRRAVEALVEVQAVWRERMHAARSEG